MVRRPFFNYERAQEKKRRRNLCKSDYCRHGEWRCGTVNANRRYFETGLEHMAEMEARWPGVLGRFFTRRLTLDLFAQGLEKASGDIKTVVQLGDHDALP